MGKNAPYTPRRGELVRDRYELRAVLGRGGDIEVVQAIDRQHDRLVALKLRRVAPEEPRDQLLAEGRALLACDRIQHVEHARMLLATSCAGR